VTLKLSLIELDLTFSYFLRFMFGSLNAKTRPLDKKVIAQGIVASN
jgi:hypothetical protein